jgi:hypothetical protein
MPKAKINKKSKVLVRFSPKRLDKRLYVFLICLLFSSLFWLLTVFSKEYTTDIAFNACFLNLPANKILVEKLPTSIAVRIKASGFALLGVQYSARRDTLFIDASNVKKQLNSNKNNQSEIYYLLLNNQLNSMADQLGGSMEIERITPDTVTFVFDQKSQKIVPVKLNLTYNFAKQYQLKGKVKIVPANIIVKGPRSLLDQINFIETHPKSINNISSTRQHILPIKNNQLQSIDYGLHAVVAEIPAEKYTEAEMVLPVRVKNMPAGYVVKTFPSEIKVTYNVSLDNYELIKPDMFMIEADFAANDEINNNRIKVKLRRYPEQVSKVKIINPQVEFILRKI